MSSTLARRAPGWKSFIASLGAICVAAFVFVDDFGRARALFVAMGALVAMAFLDALRHHRLRARSPADKPGSAPASWLWYLLAASLGAAYVPSTVLLAARGLDLSVVDPIALGAAIAVGLFARGDLRRPWWTGFAVGLLAGSVAFAFLPRTAAWAGFEEPERWASAEIAWHIDGVHAVIDRPLDPVVERINDTATEWTPVFEWERAEEARQSRVEAARAGGESCLELARALGEEALVETLSWMAGADEIGRLFDCPAARRDELEKAVARRLEARGEEEAAAQLELAGDTDRAVARARLALQIHPRAGFARAVVVHGLLARGVRSMRTGRNDAAIADLEEAARLETSDRARARAHLAMGKALFASGRRLEARDACSTASALAPGTATARMANALLRDGDAAGE